MVRKRWLIPLVAAVIILPLIWPGISDLFKDVRTITVADALDHHSERNCIIDEVYIEDDPYLGLVATPIGVWYDRRTPEAGLVPLMVDGPTSERVSAYLGLRDRMYLAGDVLEASFTASACYDSAGGVMVVPHDETGYSLGVSAVPLASYLNIPVLVVDDIDDVKREIGRLDAKYMVYVGDGWKEAGRATGLPVLPIASKEKALGDVLFAVNELFGELNYMVLSNPTDARPMDLLSVNETVMTGSADVSSVLVLGQQVDVMGDSNVKYDLEMPPGMVKLDVFLNITSVDEYLGSVKRSLGVEPIVSLELWDENGNLVAYGPSMAFEHGKAHVLTLSVDAAGTYTLEVYFYYGTKGMGPIFLPGSSGVSRMSVEYDLTYRYTTLATPHLPLTQNLSMLGPYLAAAHGGAVLAGEDFEMTDDDYAVYAANSAATPSYNPDLQEPLNLKVESNSMALFDMIASAMDHEAKNGNGTLYDSYISGPAWLSILADTNMVPMYFYEPGSEEYYPWGGLGLPGDNIYSMEFTLSTARTLGYTAADVSALIARTLFYEDYSRAYAEGIKARYDTGNEWENNYMFLYGEGGGQTAWIFWQSEFSQEVEQHGFNAEQYGRNMNNDRQTMELRGAYERANYFEMTLHGNWYWYVPEMNGPDTYSTSVKNTDVRNWELGPSIFMTAACLMGRTDGVPSREAIALNYIHAGLNTFVGSTRSTGSESGTRWMEWELLYNDTSIGEALRTAKIENPTPPTIYVRTAYADPAFNPYEPENGYSDQGRPSLLSG